MLRLRAPNNVLHLNALLFLPFEELNFTPHFTQTGSRPKALNKPNVCIYASLFDKFLPNAERLN